MKTFAFAVLALAATVLPAAADEAIFIKNNTYMLTASHVACHVEDGCFNWADLPEAHRTAVVRHIAAAEVNSFNATRYLTNESVVTQDRFDAFVASHDWSKGENYNALFLAAQAQRDSTV